MSSHPSEQNQNKKGAPEPFGEVMKSMNHFFQEPPIRGFLQSIDDFFNTPFPLSSGFHVELAETNKEFLITAQLPGIKKEQIQINVQGQQLTIAIENHRIDLEEDEKNQVIQRKQLQQHSSRTIFLPQPINEKKIAAVYRDGVLQIRIPQEKGKIIDISE